MKIDELLYEDSLNEWQMAISFTIPENERPTISGAEYVGDIRPSGITHKVYKKQVPPNNTVVLMAKSNDSDKVIAFLKLNILRPPYAQIKLIFSEVAGCGSELFKFAIYNDPRVKIISDTLMTKEGAGLWMKMKNHVDMKVFDIFYANKYDIDKVELGTEVTPDGVIVCLPERDNRPEKPKGILPKEKIDDYQRFLYLAESPFHNIKRVKNTNYINENLEYLPMSILDDYNYEHKYLYEFGKGDL